MMESSGDGPDASSIKPVSSLRSKFENLGKDEEQKHAPATTRQASLTVRSTTVPGSPRISAGEEDGSVKRDFGGLVVGNIVAPVPRQAPFSPPRARPRSMLPTTPSQMSPPMVAVESPGSSERNGSMTVRVSGSSSPMRGLDSGSATPSWTMHSRTLSRVVTPALDAPTAFFQQPSEPPKTNSMSKPIVAPTKAQEASVAIPPPVNRANKPSVPKKPPTLVQKPDTLAAPAASLEQIDHGISPFNSPPISRNTSPERLKDKFPQRPRNDSDASFVERLRSDSESSSITAARVDPDIPALQRSRDDSNTSYLERARAGSNASFVEPSFLSDSWSPPPMPSGFGGRREHLNGLTRTGTLPARYRQTGARDRTADVNVVEDRPRLPARPELLLRAGRTSPTKPRSGRSSPTKARHIPGQRSLSGPRRPATMADHSLSHQIPGIRAGERSALGQGFSGPSVLPSSVAPLIPALPAPRRSMDKRREMPSRPLQTNGQSHVDEERGLPIEPEGAHMTRSSTFPDSTRTNRRPPKYKQRPYQISTEYDTRLLAVCGNYVVTSGYLTKAWDLRTGEQLLEMPHDENVRTTAMIFKPSSNPEDEGKRIWLGTNIGEIHEVDIPSHDILKTKTTAHTRREVVRMFRYASEIWSLDDAGDLNVWKPDHKGMPSLDSQHGTFRVPRGQTFSIACGRHLWIAAGKEIRVFMPGAKTDVEFHLLRSPLTQPGTGEVTSGAILTTKPKLVYFGHTDGKVSIYNQSDFSCTGVVSVSLYKISSLVGVAGYLWAGYNTGMMYVYDPSTDPWMVKKDWQAHEKQVCGIVADPTALWKTDRLRVVTLGTDNIIRIWDGLLEEEWLESRMQEHDSEYCTFREISSAALTWNAGACKPNALQQSKDDSSFLHTYMTSAVPPDIFVFSFQELVDLDDKKMTAKSLFKGKKKDASEQEHMSHQYRAWRDYLTRCVDDYMPASEPYTLLHTASLVGLFTCVFVKASERGHIKHVHTAEVKRGMGGFHGNKGALVLRMVLDDSSICFVNCHLAAGQTQTIHRNNDIAAILESDALPVFPLDMTSPAQHSDVFASGGDGSMILDHEICILNGDLNYRIDTMGRDTVIKHVQQHNLARLLERDQLLLSKRKNPGFRLRAFTERPITFAPTYKYNVHSDEYDTSEKRRAPAWCDRILYRGLGKVKMEDYRRWEVRVSDHRPVSGRLRLRVKSVLPDKRELVWQECLREFDEYKKEVARAVQLQYLINVLGLSPKEASGALTR